MTAIKVDYKKIPYGKYVKKLVDKITRTDAPLNSSFTYYNKIRIDQTSGTPDYTAVYVTDLSDNSLVIDFSFDFRTKELNVEKYKNINYAHVIINEFARLYGNNLNFNLEEDEEAEIDDEETFSLDGFAISAN